MDQRIINTWDRFTHGGMTRRQLMDRLTELAGSSAAAVALLPLLQCDYSKAATIPETDARLATERVSYEAGKFKIGGYLARPKDKGKRPAVIVIHQNRGLNPHITDVARRIALEGFLTLAPDLLSVAGGTPDNDDKARDLHQAANKNDMMTAALGAVPFVLSHAESTGKAGAVGFCYGGGVVNRLAIGNPDLAAAVPYYGIQPPVDQVPAIKAALLLHYAEQDEYIDKGIPAYEAALKAAGKKYQVFIYPGTQHAFNDDTAGARYNKEQADIAWSRTIAFFKENLGTPAKAS